MKYQAAHTIGTTYTFWVEVGRPSEPQRLRRISDNGKEYLGPEESRFYRTNLVNPVDDPDHRMVWVRQDETELEHEFADDVPEDMDWWK